MLKFSDRQEKGTKLVKRSHRTRGRSSRNWPEVGVHPINYSDISWTLLPPGSAHVAVAVGPTAVQLLLSLRTLASLTSCVPLNILESLPHPNRSCMRKIIVAHFKPKLL